MQWMIITSHGPCYALHVPENVAVSPFGPLNSINDFFRLSAETVFANLD